ncbi:hypothetical protein N7462_001909 [Penicillium macrosclerotiorum]|uniref:uncharacterized protein n=1 Tax=Penicillium macrosclerotiorum TaxID=303699 RepID=UPI00254745A8|nr:uncharacterized protein N7462_001909 [Penicillium macrosclerotiorum]KAJ5692486.1 hypothetical protein N7462_001909 [Penicillium macrosclerotiorum]
MANSVLIEIDCRDATCLSMTRPLDSVGRIRLVSTGEARGCPEKKLTLPTQTEAGEVIHRAQEKRNLLGGGGIQVPARLIWQKERSLVVIRDSRWAAGTERLAANGKGKPDESQTGDTGKDRPIMWLADTRNYHFDRLSGSVKSLEAIEGRVVRFRKDD